VLAHDLRLGIPFPDGHFDAVYHAHLLEHLAPAEAARLLAECRRVLRPGGVLRVVVPDLEAIARLYLEALERAERGEPEWPERYDWAMLELYDQCIREESGGAIRAWLARDPVPAREFVLSRVGEEGRGLLEAAATGRLSGGALATLRPGLARRVWRLLRHPAAAGEALKRRLLGEDYAALRVGRFHRSGEVHRWMYDRYSLRRALEAAGFADVRTVGPAESRIADWARYGLDCGPDGSPRKPDSLYLEAVRVP
jgi:SAM-dependent methyltransferase